MVLNELIVYSSLSTSTHIYIVITRMCEMCYLMGRRQVWLTW